MLQAPRGDKIYGRTIGDAELQPVAIACTNPTLPFYLEDYQ